MVTIYTTTRTHIWRTPALLLLVVILPSLCEAQSPWKPLADMPLGKCCEGFGDRRRPSEPEPIARTRRPLPAACGVKPAESASIPTRDACPVRMTPSGENAFRRPS